MLGKRMMVLLVGAALAVSMLATMGVAWAQEALALPADPSGLGATASSSSQIDLQWSDNASNESAYTVERSPDGVDGWTEIAPALPANSTSYSDAGLSPNTAYHYRVRATNASGPSGYSAVASATTPDAPAYLFSDGWNLADGAAWDNAKWAADGGATAALDVQSGQGRMRFENVSGARARAIAKMTKVQDTEVLASFRFPSGDPKGYLQFFSRASDAWTGGFPASSYYVEVANDSSSVSLRKSSGGTVTQLRSGSVGQLTAQKQWVRLRVEGSSIKAKVWTDGTTEPAGWELETTDASFSGPGVLAIRWARASAATGARDVYLDDLTVRDLNTTSPVPADPSGLGATAVSTSQIELQWTDNANNEGAYAVERSPDGVDGWTEIAPALPADSTSYSDAGLSPNTTYHYRVKATNGSGSSGYSPTTSTTTYATSPAAPTINATPDDTWMTNGRVYSVIRYGDYIYVGGKFTRVRNSPTGSSFVATNLARFDADTGVGDPTWTPDVTGTDMTKTQVYSLVEAGGKIWVGGNFGAVDGIARRNLAAVSPGTGAVDPNVDTLVGSETSGAVRAMVASSTKVYLGGGFSAVDGRTRTYLAALDLSGNVDTAWKPKASNIVRSLAFSSDRATVFAGGIFRRAAGSDGVYSDRESIARFDATSGALDPWTIPAGSVGNENVAVDLAVTPERITAAYLGSNYARSFRLDNGNTGTMVWADKCGGDVQTVTMLGSDKVVMGGHFSQVAGEKRTRIALVNLSNGVPDPSWTPAVEGGPSLDNGPWDLLVSENRLYVGGEFTSVAGLSRTNFTRFTLN